MQNFFKNFLGAYLLLAMVAWGTINNYQIRDAVFTVAKIASGSKLGDGTKVVTTNISAPASTKCAQIESNGRLSVAADVCGAGGGGGGSYTAGPGIDDTALAGGEIRLNSTSPTMNLGNSSNNWGSITAGRCESPVDVAVSGVSSGDPDPAVSTPVSFTAGFRLFARVVAADTVRVWACNDTGSNGDPGGDLPFNIWVHKTR